MRFRSVDGDASLPGMDLGILAAVAAVFLLAGTVKGTIGMGLPTISLGLMVAFLDLPVAMAMVVVPSLLTNVWQAATGGRLKEIIARHWPFYLAATGTIWIGGVILAQSDFALLSALLGGILVVYALVGLAGYRPKIAPERKTGAGLGLGALNGLFTGLTGAYIVPGLLYLQAAGFTRDAFIQAMGLLFLLSTIGLAANLAGLRFYTGELLALSTLAMVPTSIGLYLGVRLRRLLSEAAFRKVFLISTLALGVFIIVKVALLG